MDVQSIISHLLHLENLRTYLLCLAVFAFLYWYFQKPTNVPPGPFEWPIIGSLPVLLKSAWHQEEPHGLMLRLSQRYGKVFSFGVGSGVRVVVLNDFKSIKEGFQKAELSDRILGSHIEKVTPGRGVLLASGPVWRQQRRFSLTVFRSLGVGKTSFDEQMAAEADNLCQAIAEYSGEPFDPRRLLMMATSNMICALTFGKQFDYNDAEFHRLLNILDERVKLIGSGSLQTSVPLLSMLRPQGMRALQSCLETTLDYLKDIVAEHKNNFEEEGECNDLTDLYLKAMKKEGANDEDIMNEDHLMMLVDNLFLAGTETSSNTLAWCLLRLIAHPEVQHRIREEIRSVCSGEEGRLLGYADRVNMPYTEAVILEVQRLHTIVPLGVPHFAGRETTVQGYTIPKGSIIIGNLWAVHHDPDVWGDPDVFRPERFLDEDGQVQVGEEWMPFSTGRRVCLGERLAKMEIFIFLTHLLSRYTVKKPSDSSALSFEGRSGATYGPKPFEVCAEPVHIFKENVRLYNNIV